MDKSEFEHTCRTIVNQLFDVAEVPVKKRQEINDMCDDYVQERVLELLKKILIPDSRFDFLK